MAPSTLPAPKRRLPSIRESPPTSPSFAKRSSGFFSFRRQSLPSSPPPRASSSKKSSTDSTNIVAVPETPDPLTFGSPPLPPTPVDAAEESEDQQEQDVPRPPRSSGTFGFTGVGDEELMFEELGPASREDSRRASSDSLGEVEAMAAPVEVKGEEGIASPPLVVVLVDSVEGSQEVLDSPFELEDSTYGQLHLPSDSVDSLPEQRRGGTFGISPSPLLLDSAARPHPAPPLIPLLSTPPPPTSFFPRSLHHQSSNLTIFLTPQSSPSSSLANIDPLASPQLDVDALAPLPLPVEASPPEVTPMKGAEEAVLELPLSAERGSTEASDNSELRKSGSLGGRREESSREGGELGLSSTPSPVQTTFPPPLLLRPLLPRTTTPTFPASVSLTSLQEHRTRLTTLATTLQAESRRLSESRNRLEEVNASLSAELDLIVLEIERERRTSSTRDRRSSAGASVRMPMVDFLREDANQTDDEGGRVRVGVRGGGSGLKDEVVLGPMMSEGTAKDLEKSEKERKKKKRRSWGARLFGGGGDSKSKK